MRIAIIRNGVIATIVEASSVADVQESVPDATCREAAPEENAAPEAPTSKFVTAQEFRDLFTQDELLGMMSSNDNGVRLLMFKVQTNISGIDLLGAEAQQGLAYLVSNSLLAADRPGQITG